MMPTNCSNECGLLPCDALLPLTCEQARLVTDGLGCGTVCLGCCTLRVAGPPSHPPPRSPDNLLVGGNENGDGLGVAIAIAAAAAAVVILLLAVLKRRIRRACQHIRHVLYLPRIWCTRYMEKELNGSTADALLWQLGGWTFADPRTLWLIEFVQLALAQLTVRWGRGHPESAFRSNGTAAGSSSRANGEVDGTQLFLAVFYVVLVIAQCFFRRSALQHLRWAELFVAGVLDAALSAVVITGALGGALDDAWSVPSDQLSPGTETAFGFAVVLLCFTWIAVAKVVYRDFDWRRRGRMSTAQSASRQEKAAETHRLRTIRAVWYKLAVACAALQTATVVCHAIHCQALFPEVSGAYGVLGLHAALLILPRVTRPSIAAILTAAGIPGTAYLLYVTVRLMEHTCDDPARDVQRGVNVFVQALQTMISLAAITVQVALLSASISWMRFRRRSEIDQVAALPTARNASNRNSGDATPDSSFGDVGSPDEASFGLAMRASMSVLGNAAGSSADGSFGLAMRPMSVVNRSGGSSPADSFRPSSAECQGSAQAPENNVTKTGSIKSSSTSVARRAPRVSRAALRSIFSWRDAAEEEEDQGELSLSDALPSDFARLPRYPKKAVLSTIRGDEVLLHVPFKRSSEKRFLQVDIAQGTLRWSWKDYIGFDQIEDVFMSVPEGSGDSFHHEEPSIDAMLQELAAQRERAQQITRLHAEHHSGFRNSCHVVQRGTSADSAPPQRSAIGIDSKIGGLIAGQFARKHNPRKWLIVEYRATDPRAHNQTVQLAIFVPREKRVDMWCVGLRAILLKRQRPRLLPSCSLALNTWMRDVMQAVDRKRQGCVHARKKQLLLAAANLRLSQTAPKLDRAGTSPLRRARTGLSVSVPEASERDSFAPSVSSEAWWNIEDVQKQIIAHLVGAGTADAPGVRQLFECYASEVRLSLSDDEPLMRLDEYLQFCREEQHETDDDAATALFKKMANAPQALDGSGKLRRELVVKNDTEPHKGQFVTPIRRGSAGLMLEMGRFQQFDSAQAGLSMLQFQQLLLNESNRALCPDKIGQGKTAREAGDFSKPLTHYWVACSHNSYLDGDQIASNSTAEMYARLLLQGCRAIEIDCWDGEDDVPDVTHGGTLCTRVKFEECLIALRDHAFAASPLPVQISLEMHCSPRQQRKIAHLFSTHLTGVLLVGESSNFTQEQRNELAPSDLLQRVLIKGKVVPLATAADERKSGKRLLMRKFWRRPPFLRSQAAAKSSDGFGRSERRSSDESIIGTDMLFAASHLPRDSIRGRSAPHLPRDRSRCGHLDQADPLGTCMGAATSMRRRASSFVSGALPLDDDDEDGPGCRERRCSRAGVILGALSHTATAGARAVLPDLAPVHEESTASARSSRQTLKKRVKKQRPVDSELVKVIAMPSVPLEVFLGEEEDRRSARRQLLNVTSIGEKKLERLEGEEVRKMQSRTLVSHGRAFPSGLRTDSSNLDPVIGWRAGIQMVALNLQTNDVPTQLHYALFELSGENGYVLKPAEMREADAAWPPARKTLTRVDMQVISLHHLPSRGEQRPRVISGKHSACHGYVKHLSGAAMPPKATMNAVTSPSIRLELYPIDGFCCVSGSVSPKDSEIATSYRLPQAVDGNGLVAEFNQVAHCLAASPLETILRVVVLDNEAEVAYDTAVLGALRQGYRCFQLRKPSTGTRIELCSLLAHIRIGQAPHVWAEKEVLKTLIEQQQETVEQQERQLRVMESELILQRKRVAELESLSLQLPAPPASPRSPQSSCGDSPQSSPSIPMRRHPAYTPQRMPSVGAPHGFQRTKISFRDRAMDPTRTDREAERRRSPLTSMSSSSSP